MTPFEKDAILEYVEFNFSKLLEEVENHVDEDYVPILWEMAKHGLVDLERTMGVQVELDHAELRQAAQKRLKK